MKNKSYLFIGIILVLILVGFLVYRNSGNIDSVANSGTQTATTTTQANTPQAVEYKNTEYGFTFLLPQSWKGYSIIEDEWGEDGSWTDGSERNPGGESGPLISIRHPDWEYKSPRQDIPIMVFTIKQWNDMQAEKFHIGAAPINPSELGRNTKYVFALPARYNFADAVGMEEVNQIIEGKPLKTF
ncbi:MAG: hypothetical protein V4473_01775 [Patescibacteria group bacterium]